MNSTDLINNRMAMPKNELVTLKIRQRRQLQKASRKDTERKREILKKYEKGGHHRIIIIKFPERKKMEKTKYLEKITNNFPELREDKRS